MIKAVCTHLDVVRTFDIKEFQCLTEAEIQKFRQYLECSECKGKAFYRKESTDGKSACFGSRYHSESCSEARLSAQVDLEILHSKEISKVISSAKEIIFDFSFNNSKNKLVSASEKITRPDDNENKEFVDLPERPQFLAMDMALNSLIRSNELSQSEILIEIDNGYKFKAKNLFVNFSCAIAAENSKLAKPKMYWGTISYTDRNFDWLNPSDCEDVGVSIKKFKDVILRRFDIRDRRDIEGAGIILFGKCFWNQLKTRKIIEVWNNERIYISKIEE